MTLIRTRKIIDDAGAAAALDAAEAAANGARVVMAVVDPWGELVALRRTARAQAASSRVAVDKASTAAIFVRPSREMEEQVSGGRIGALALHGAACLTGGIPLVVDGEVVGAIGTSGETPDEDEAISLAGAAAEVSVSAMPALTYEGARQVAEAAGAEAARRGVAPVVSVVDPGGALVYLVRPDAARPGARPGDREGLRRLLVLGPPVERPAVGRPRRPAPPDQDGLRPHDPPGAGRLGGRAGRAGARLSSTTTLSTNQRPASRSLR
jgi:glc operon protein GlcG